MADFDPEDFEAKKYREYFPQLQNAYKRAFDRLNDEYDSRLVHAIDQQILDESEPVYEDGEFELELPPDPIDRLDGAFGEERAAEVVELYVDEIERQLGAVFGVEGRDEPKA